MKKPKSDKADLIRSVLIGTVISLLVMAALCVIAAACVQAQKIPEHAVRYIGWAISALSAAAGCLAAMRLAGRNYLPVSMISVMLLICVMLAIHLIAGDRQSTAWQSAVFAGAAAVITASLAAGRRKGRR